MQSDALPDSAPAVVIAFDRGILTVTLNRPERRNAIGARCLAELHAALDRARLDDAVRGVVLTGAGTAFCAGADIHEYATATLAVFERFTETANEFCTVLSRLPKPVLAAANGLALGGGFEIVLAADVVFAADSATFGLPETSLGLIPGWAGTQRLTNVLGQKRALEHIWTGGRLTAEDGHRHGFVNRVCAPDELLPAAVEFLRTLAARPANALAAAKLAVRHAAIDAVDLGAVIEREALYRLFTSESGQEGVAAFAQKRSPRFEPL